MAQDEKLVTTVAPEPVANPYEPIDPDRAVIDRGDDADFVIATNRLGGILETHKARGDRVTRKDLEDMGITDIACLVKLKAIIPLREVDLSPLKPVKVTK